MISLRSNVDINRVPISAQRGHSRLWDVLWWPHPAATLSQICKSNPKLSLVTMELSPQQKTTNCLVIFVLPRIISIALSMCFPKELRAAMCLHSGAESCSQQCECKMLVFSVASLQSSWCKIRICFSHALLKLDDELQKQTHQVTRCFSVWFFLKRAGSLPFCRAGGMNLPFGAEFSRKD